MSEIKMQPLTMRKVRDVIAVPALMVRSGVDTDVFTKSPTYARIVGFDCDALGDSAAVLASRVGSRSILDSRFADGRYRVSDLKRMLPEMTGIPVAKPMEEIVISLRFDWPGGDKCEPQEFRCWWIAEVMR
jgi:hypothetical protein